MEIHCSSHFYTGTGRPMKIWTLLSHSKAKQPPADSLPLLANGNSFSFTFDKKGKMGRKFRLQSVHIQPHPLISLIVTNKHKKLDVVCWIDVYRWIKAEVKMHVILLSQASVVTESVLLVPSLYSSGSILTDSCGCRLGVRSPSQSYPVAFVLPLSLWMSQISVRLRRRATQLSKWRKTKPSIDSVG